jgi:hypothetical protein
MNFVIKMTLLQRDITVTFVIFSELGFPVKVQITVDHMR